MKKYINGVLCEASSEELVEIEIHRQTAEREYWATVSYDEAVNIEIRKRYTESQEFAILRQKDEKNEEYAEYYAYCEERKAYVKEQKRKFSF